MKVIKGSVIVMLLAAPAAAAASTPQGNAALDRASAAVCLAAADLAGGRVGPTIRFSDRTRMDARMVTGTWRPAHMGGAPARMLCLFDRPPQAFFEALGLADGWRTRQPVYRLWPLLVHLRLFGGGYAAQVEAALSALGH